MNNRHRRLVESRVILAALVWALLPLSARAEFLTFSFTDPVGDATGPSPDLVGMVFNFDNTTGAFEITLTAAAANPFRPIAPLSLVAVISIYNADTGTTAQDPSYFNLFSVLTLSAPAPTVTLTGTNPRLLAWEAGDRVAASTSVLGNPDGVGQFGSFIRVFDGRPIVGQDAIAPGAVTTILPAAIPEPGSITLLGVAALGLLGYGWGCQKPRT